MLTIEDEIFQLALGMYNNDLDKMLQYNIDQDRTKIKDSITYLKEILPERKEQILTLQDSLKECSHKVVDINTIIEAVEKLAVREHDVLKKLIGLAEPEPQLNSKLKAKYTTGFNNTKEIYNYLLNGDTKVQRGDRVVWFDCTQFLTVRLSNKDHVTSYTGNFEDFAKWSKV